MLPIGAGFGPVKLILTKLGVDHLMFWIIFFGGLLVLNISFQTVDYLVKRTKADAPISFNVGFRTVVLLAFLLLFITVHIIRRLWTK